MSLIEHLSLLTVWDALAAGFILLAWIIVGWLIEHPPASSPSVSTLMADYRREWMDAFEERDNRIFDAQMMGTLRQGTSFFASSSLLAIGGVLALVGNTDQLRGVALEFSEVDTPAFVWQLKLILVGFFLTFAFLKFVWAHRLFGYCAVVMGTLRKPGSKDGKKHALQAAELNIRASINFTRGLRAMYFSLGALGWAMGPVMLCLTTALVLWVLWTREFNSAPRDILLAKD